jgi:hypothetical protein
MHRNQRKNKENIMKKIFVESVHNNDHWQRPSKAALEESKYPA